MVDPKIFENRVRRAAKRQGLRVVKSRRRDPRASDYGTYTIFDKDLAPSGLGGLRLFQVAEYLEDTDVLDRSATTVRTDFAQLIEKWDLLAVSNELEDLRKKLREADQPKTAREFAWSLGAFLVEFR